MTWPVIGVIAALCGLAVALLTPAVKLNASITRLTVTVERLVRKLDELTENRCEEQGRLRNRNSDPASVPIGQESRISTQEHHQVS